MAEADFSPTTFTSRSASDPDYDNSTENSYENENQNTYTEASLIIHHQIQKQKTMQRLKSAGVRRCQRRSEMDKGVIP